jgi:thiol-disulfide isomerase/thioredoxin
LSADRAATLQLRWFSADGKELWGLSLESASIERLESVDLKADRWFKPLPDIDVPLMTGGAFSLRGDGLGNVMILDFWATWCEPCKRELPRLQALHEEMQDRGLKVLAVNVQEPASTALPYAEELGLTMPIASYSEEVEEAIPFSKLPLVILADRWGRMRVRWDGYEEGYELKIADLARRFMEEQKPPSEKVAELLSGKALMRISWSRETTTAVAGLAVVPAAGGGSKLLASVGRSLVSYETGGQTGQIWDTASAPGVPRSSSSAGGAGYMVAAFRPGSEKLTILRMPEGTLENVSSPSPVFDVAPLDASSMLLATYAGLMKMSIGAAEAVSRLEDFDGTAAVRLQGEEEERRVVVLEFGGRLTWMDPAMRISARTQASSDGWRLLTDAGAPDEAGVLPPAATAAVTGNFLKDHGTQGAVATEDGRLLLIDLHSGRELLHARWPDITDLAAGDLDGDGLDELVVAAGSRISVLTAATP